MDLRMRRTSVLNVWPAFTDVAITMLLILLFFLFIQFLSDIKPIQQMRREKKQEVMQREFEKRFADEIERGIIGINVDGNLQSFSFSDRILFETAKAELQPLGRMTLTDVGRLLLQRYTEGDKGQWHHATAAEGGEILYQSVQINGHTDNVPIETLQFPSNWELSSARAIAVLRLFVDDLQMDPLTLLATGYGKYHPVASNASVAGRAKNRRIEIILVYSETGETE